jgi:hypothetical protein
VKNLESRLSGMEKALSIRCSGNPQDCGLGVPVRRGTPPRAHWCALYQYSCWYREDPLALAQAEMLLAEMRSVQDAVRAGKSWGQAWQDAQWDGGVNTSNPPPELIEQCRKYILAKGVELYSAEEEGT